MNKKFYKYLKSIAEATMGVGLTFMFLLALIFYCVSNDVKWYVCDLMTIPVGVTVLGIICEFICVFINDHFKFEKSEEL